MQFYLPGDNENTVTQPCYRYMLTQQATVQITSMQSHTSHLSPNL